MDQPQFISHAKVVATPSLVPRRGLGLFSALAFVLAVLGGAVTGGIILVDKSTQASLEEARKNLLKLRQDIEFDSIKQAQSLQQRIDIARQLLGGHLYASRGFDFVELHTLPTTRITAFSYTNGKIKIDEVTRGFVPFAQQIKYYRSLGDNFVKSFTFQNPTLNDKGEAVFSVEITLSPKFLASQSQTPVSTPQPSATPQPLATPRPSSSPVPGDENQ